MTTLLKKSVRDVFNLGWRAVTISLITALGVAVFSGGFMAQASLSYTRDYYYKSLRLADLDVYFKAATAEEMPNIDMPGVKYVKRFIYQTSLDMPGKEPISLVIVHQRQFADSPVNNLKILRGKPLEIGDKEGILIDRAFADFHKFKVGDKLGLRSWGFPIQLTIRGIVVTPEYLVPMGSPYMLVPLKGSLGVAFASLDRVEEAFGYPLYNNLAFIYDRKGPDKKDAVLAALKGLKLEKITVKRDQFSYKWLEQDLRGFDVFIPAMVFLFGVVVCVVTMMVFNRLIQAQRREIGVLMALGYRRRRIFISFMVTGFSLGVLGSLIGQCLAVPNCWLLAGLYANYMDMPELLYIYPAAYALEGFFIGLFLSIFSSTLPLLRIFKVSPQEAIRHTESSGALPRILDVTRFIRIRALSLKYSARNLVRRPGVSFATIGLVTLAVSICTAFYASTKSWDDYADKSLKKEKWDLISMFRVSLSPEEAAKAWSKKEISHVRPFLAEPAEIRIKGAVKDFAVHGSADLGEMVELNFAEGGGFSSDHAFEIMFSLVDHMPVKPGESVTVLAGGSEYRFKVAGILNRMTTGIAYVPLETAKKLFSYKIRGFCADSTLPAVKIKEVLYSDDNVAWVHPKSDIKTAVLEFLSDGKVVTDVALWISIAMAMLFLLTGVTINIRDREGEYATLSSLGFSYKFLASLIISETVIEGTIAIILSVPISYLFTKYLNDEMAKAWFKMDLYFKPRELIEVMGYAFAFLPVAAIPGIRHIFKMNIPMTVRRKSFG